MLTNHLITNIMNLWKNVIGQEWIYDFIKMDLIQFCIFFKKNNVYCTLITRM